MRERERERKGRETQCNTHFEKERRVLERAIKRRERDRERDKKRDSERALEYECTPQFYTLQFGGERTSAKQHTTHTQTHRHTQRHIQP